MIESAEVDGQKLIYRAGLKFAKAGVILMDLQPDSVMQGELALEDDDVACTSGLMAALDELNQRYGRGTVQIASAGLAGERRVWSMKQERRTPGYTTCWADMLVVRA